MNKTAIQKFAVEAHKALVRGVEQRAYNYGVTAESCGDPDAATANGRVLTDRERSQRRDLVEAVQAKGYAEVMEEAAYTWFNRFIALRYMELNDYLPTHVRVFSNAAGAFEPEILREALHLDLPGLDRGLRLDLVGVQVGEVVVEGAHDEGGAGQKHGQGHQEDGTENALGQVTSPPIL